MAGMVIPFFQRQVMAGSQGIAVDFYSDVYSVTDYAFLTTEVVIYSSNPAAATITVYIEGSSDPTLGNTGFSTLTTIAVLTAGGLGEARGSTAAPLRFVRARVTMPSTTYSTVMVQGVARESS